MKILYDLATFLPIYLRLSDAARTGVFRFVDNLAKSFIQEPRCDIDFCSSQLTDEEEKWLFSYRLLDKIGDRPYWLQETPLPFYSKVHQWRCSLQNKKNLFKKLGYNLFRSLEKSCRPLPINPDIKGLFDIYFSPYHPVPRQLRTASCKSFVVVHDLIYKRFPNYFSVNKEKFFQRLIEKAAKNQFFFCVSQTTKNDLCELYSIDPDRAFIVNSAPTPGLFYPCTDPTALAQVRKRYRIPDGVNYFLSVSTLEPRKNIPHLIRCFSKLVLEEKLSDVYLVLAGPLGWNYDEIFVAIDHFSTVKPFIIFTGFVQDEDLAPLYSQALAFIFPSLYEGFGLPPLEAMNCETPVIASNCSSLPEVVGDAALLVDPKDEETLCDHLLKLYSDRALRSRLKVLSKERAKLFTWEKNKEAALQAFKTVLG